MVHTQEGSFLYVSTKFEVDSSIHYKGPKISKLGHVTLSLLNLERYICVEIHLRIPIAKFCVSILIRC